MTERLTYDRLEGVEGIPRKVQSIQISVSCPGNPRLERSIKSSAASPASAKRKEKGEGCYGSTLRLACTCF